MKRVRGKKKRIIMFWARFLKQTPKQTKAWMRWAASFKLPETIPAQIDKSAFATPLRAIMNEINLYENIEKYQRRFLLNNPVHLYTEEELSKFPPLK